MSPNSVPISVWSMYLNPEYNGSKLSSLGDLVSLKSSQFGVALLLQTMNRKIVLSG